MPRKTELDDRQLIERYTDQPARLPESVRVRLERAVGAAPVRLYALCDLDEAQRLTRRWVVLTDRYLLQIPEDAGGLCCIERRAVASLSNDSGLTSRTVRLHGADAGAPLCTLRYTRRQQHAVEPLIFALEQGLEGRPVVLGDPDRIYLEGLARPIRDAQALVSSHQLAVLWRLLAYLAPYRKRVAIGMGAASLITLLAMVPPYLSGYLVDEVVGPVQAGDLAAGQVSLIAWLAVAGIAGTYVLRQLCQFVRLRLMAVLGELVARDLRRDLYEHLQRMSVGFFARRKTGSLITRVVSDTDRLWDFLALGVVDVSLAVIMLTGLSAVLIHLDWRLGLVMTAPLPLVFYAIHRHGQHLERLFLRAWRRWSRVTDVVSDTIPGMRVVKAFNQEQRELGRFGQRNDDAFDEFTRIHEYWTVFWPALMFVVQFSVVGIWAFALPRMLGEGTLLGPPLSVGTFVSFLLYTTMFTAPVEIIGQMTRIMNRATSSAHRVFEVLDSQPEITEVSEPVRLEEVKGHVRFENVSFSYDGIRPVLSDLTFEVRPGELIGLVGASGGGKSTLVSLIARFYDATAGCIRVDGVDVRELDLGCYRRQVGMVLQDPYLFQGSVLENIRYGCEDASLERVVEAARIANAHDFICKLPHGYDTTVGERGQTLSGGERQRISIARAVLADPRILILDEATSAVDTETERNIQQAMDRLVRGRTVFAIAHRLSTVRRASRLLVIDDGRIAEMGTHTELLAKRGGIYRKLHQLQQEVAEAI